MVYIARSGFVTVAISFFFQAEDGILDLVRSRGVGDVYKRQYLPWAVVVNWQWPVILEWLVKMQNLVSQK